MENLNGKYDVIVVGGGASGLVAAGIAGKTGASVLLLERNDRVGRKLMITGKGRCNLTNNCDRETLLNSAMRNSKFLYGAFSAFNAQQVMEFFEGLGVPLKTERGNRVFPISDKSVDIVDALRNFVKDNGVHVMQKRVGHLICEDDVIKGIKTVDGKEFYGKSVIVATGGLSYPLTGSTGDGYELAKEVGHTVEPTASSLVPIILKEKWCSDLMGLSLKNITLTVKKKDKVIFKDLGELMFTHFGISGPLVLSASALMDGKIDEFKLFVDLKPGLDENKLDTRILRDFGDEKNRAFRNSLNRLLPHALCSIIVGISGIKAETPVNSITREERKNLVNLIKAMPLTPVGLRPVEEAVVTRGGVSTKEINPKTMESKKIKGLFFCGEVMDVDAVTGGFNLQIAFSTGFLAGKNSVL